MKFMRSTRSGHASTAKGHQTGAKGRLREIAAAASRIEGEAGKDFLRGLRLEIDSKWTLIASKTARAQSVGVILAVHNGDGAKLPQASQEKQVSFNNILDHAHSGLLRFGLPNRQAEIFTRQRSRGLIPTGGPDLTATKTSEQQTYRSGDTPPSAGVRENIGQTGLARDPAVVDIYPPF
jgi:hypothetical protein